MNLETMADWITDYVRIRRTEKRDPEAIRSGLQKGLGIAHPERIMGYAGFFFDLGDVYASGYVASMMGDKRFRTFVDESLKRFIKGDYGDVSRNDADENIENRCLFGIDRIFGRYGYDMTDREADCKDPYLEVICIRKHEGNTWVTVDSEMDWFLFLEEDEVKMFGDWNGEEE